MTDRLYSSWPYEAAEKAAAAAYYAQAAQTQLYPQPTALPPGSLCADFNNNSAIGLANGLRYFNANGLLGYNPSLLPSKYTPVTGMANQVDVCQYAHTNGSTSCYNRNRYMPYNHNRNCAAAAAVAAVSGHPLVNHPHQHNHQQQQQPLQQHQTQASVATAMSLACASSVGYQSYGGYAPIYQQTSMCSLNQPSLVTPSLPPVTISSTGSVNPMTAPVTPSVTIPATSVSEFSYSNSLLSTAASSVATCSVTATSTTASSTNSAEPSTSTTTTSSGHNYATVTDPGDAVTLQITNLDYSLDETSLRNFLMNQLKPITPVVSLVFEGSSYAKVTVPDLYFAKQVVSNLHRKKIGHKRMLVSYTRDSSLTEVNTLRCQVAGLLKDVPYYTLPMYKFRELFQSRFKTSISVLDLYKMQDICTINSDNNEDKFISLQPELVNTLESSPLMEGLQHSVPYCTVHFKREQHKGWAEQDIEPLPNVCMTIAEIQKLIYPLLKHHPGDIPVATLLHCIEGQLKVQIDANESGVNLEHLVCCVQGIQIQVNNFGIKILGWLELNKDLSATNSTGSNLSLNSSDRPGNSNGGGGYFKNSAADPLYQISREVIELVKMSPKSTMKFNRFIPAYHNHFGKQCRVADYGYTKLIELFEALSSVVQIMGDGENRQITLTHRTQIRRFTSDLLRVLRAHGNNSVLLSQLPGILAQSQNRNFDVTDYGVCDLVDILDGLVNSNIVVLSPVQQGKDILISMPKRKQTNNELEKTSVFAGEMVELFQNALQYTILFQKFVRSYHYHFAFQCRLSDYGFLKLADLMDAIHGVVEIEVNSDEEKKIMLSPKVARRVFAIQCEDLIRNATGNSTNSMKLEQVLKMHKKKYGYQIQPHTLGVTEISQAIDLLPYVEVQHKEQATWLICHNDDVEFRKLCYRACKQLLQREVTQKESPSTGSASKTTSSTTSSSPTLDPLPKTKFLTEFNAKHKVQLTESALLAMRHAIEIYEDGDESCVRLTGFMRFLISIVRLLEQRPNMYLHEIKTGLDCGLSTTFEFGFPTLYSVITAHDDLFTLNSGPTQERSDVSLNVNCELRLSSGASHQHLFGSLKLPYAKHKTQRSIRTPLGEHNRPPPAQAPPPHKTRAIANEYAGSVANGSNATFKPQVNSSNNNNNNNNNSFQSYQENFPATQPIAAKCSPPSANSSVISSTLLNSSGLGSGSLSLCSSCCNKENSMNTSLQFFNSSFNSSSDLNASLGASDLGSIASTSAIAPYGNASKLWQRRHSSFFQKQQQSQHQILPSTIMPHTVDATGDIYDLVSCNVAPISSIYEPPKPDTPPTEKLPFWIDPIWSNQADQPRQNILNIRLPELKSHNVLPMLLSPYTLSKHENMKRQLFNFDNHDRKIA